MSAQLQLPMTEQKRLGRQLEAVREICVTGGKWWTLAEIVTVMRICLRPAIYASEPGVSARLRDLRKLGYTVDRRRRSGNLWEYRVER